VEVWKEKRKRKLQYLKKRGVGRLPGSRKLTVSRAKLESHPE